MTTHGRKPVMAWLHRLNPLAKIAATLPAMVIVLVSRDVQTPLVAVVVSLMLVAVGARLAWRWWALLVVVAPVAVALLALSFALWVDPDRVEQSSVVLRFGAIAVTKVAIEIGLATALRLAGLFALALVWAASSSGADLVRALIAQLRVPYRIGYTALAALRFVPRFKVELEIILAAHRVRGVTGGRGPIASARRTVARLVPLLAAAIRHAERVALAMDARAFGAYSSRAERHPVTFSGWDFAFVLICWALTAVAVVAGRAMS